MLSYKRSVRVAELIQQEISKIVQNLKEPNLGFVTITAVKLTDDLQSARIFFSVIGNDDEIKMSSSILQESIPNIRYQLARNLNLRRTPSLVFEFDDTPTKANRIYELLEKIRQEDSPNDLCKKITKRKKTSSKKK